MTEILSVMVKLLERMSHNQNYPNQNSNGSISTFTDHKDTIRKSMKAFSSLFSKELFSGKSGDNWYLHQERFIKPCNLWEIPMDSNVYYLQESLSADAFNYFEGKL